MKILKSAWNWTIAPVLPPFLWFKLSKIFVFAESNAELFSVLKRLGQYTVCPERMKLTFDQKRSRFPPLKKVAEHIFPGKRKRKFYFWFIIDMRYKRRLLKKKLSEIGYWLIGVQQFCKAFIKIFPVKVCDCFHSWGVRQAV